MERPLFKFSPASTLACIILVLTAPLGHAGSVAAPYQIATWAGFRSGAVTYTFDDDCPNQYAVAVPMFHAAGLKMTLFTVTSWMGNWPAAQNAAAWGDEIASHTVTHPDLATVNHSKLANELGAAQSVINSHITNESCVTLAYPYCTVPDESVTAQYYIAARSCSGRVEHATPSDFFDITSFVVGKTGRYTTGDSLNQLADIAADTGGWCVYLIHAIDGDNGYSPLSSAALQASVNYTSANSDKFWVETFGNVVRYIKERDASSIIEISHTGASITLQVTNDLPSAIYNYPITIRRLHPPNWTGISVSQNNQPIPAKVTVIGTGYYATFDIVPNAGNVILQNAGPVRVQAPPAN
jgi:oligosaccharide reducing-end xylanase